MASILVSAIVATLFIVGVVEHYRGYSVKPTWRLVGLATLFAFILGWALRSILEPFIQYTYI